MPTTIIYHGPRCRDGFTAAWVAYQKFGEEALYLPANYGEEPPDVSGQDVFILDFSYPRDVLEKMAVQASSIEVIDHHKTAQEALQGLPYAHFDMERSGAMMAWDRFFPDKEAPLLVRYVQDRDLWRFNLPGSREVNAYIGTVPFTFGEWRTLHGNFDVLSYCRLGTVAMNATQHFVEAELDKLVIHSQNTIQYGLINSSYQYASELGHHVLEKYQDLDFVAVWQQGPSPKQRGPQGRTYSLRSRGYDVGSLAEHFGGGGHRCAAGFEVLPSVSADPATPFDLVLGD